MSIGVVVIGRNEGERLRKCLESVTKVTKRVVYVDSGSTDGSVSMVQGMGLDVVELDMSIPFTAARARNEGSKLLLKHDPGLDYIQFVDGDCELVGGWLETAAAFMDANTKAAMVCGRLRERYPERSVYNMLCDSEWDTALGMTKACGGIAMARKDAFEAGGGFRADLIAGEESELCLRLRAKGWQIWRLDAEMALHDAAMTRFGQWWKRSRRGGYAYAEGVHLHGASPERHRVTESRRIWLWGLGIPAVAIGLTIYLWPWGLAALLIYPAQVTRLALRGTRTSRENWIRAFFLVLSKFPEAMGQLNYLYNRLAGETARLIEYK
ncbi:MAG: glycosyltransferase [Gammaproteobacteria bacterium]|nr:glycosyltransferase [Gammaproteobacteria bacterium]MBU1483034.1 glycosyltransferase [Gammaproteobacteria bacterium]